MSANLEYQRYPLVMTHPAASPAMIGRFEQDSQGNIVADIKGKPATNQPVTVHNSDQEQQYRALGYDTPGNPDPRAYRSAHAAPYKPGSVPQYPMLVDGQMVDDPAGPAPGIAQYPKALNHPNGSGQVFVANEDEEVETLARWETEFGAEGIAKALPPEDELTRLRREVAELRLAEAVRTAVVEPEPETEIEPETRKAKRA